MRQRILAAALVGLLFAVPAPAQSPGTVNLVGPSTSPGAPQLTPAAINAAVNAALTAKLDASVVGFNAGFLAWFASLPTTLPASPGVAWNNGGVLCVS